MAQYNQTAWNDEIVEEVRNTREKIASLFNYDMNAYFEDVMRRHEKRKAEGEYEYIPIPREEIA